MRRTCFNFVRKNFFRIVLMSTDAFHGRYFLFSYSFRVNVSDICEQIVNIFDRVAAGHRCSLLTNCACEETALGATTANHRLVWSTDNTYTFLYFANYLRRTFAWSDKLPLMCTGFSFQMHNK
jgi:hypothetical protein